MEFKDYLKIEQVKELYSRILFVLVTTFGISALTMSSISDGFPLSHVIGWLAATSVIIIIRFWCFRYYDPDNVTVENHDKWLKQHAFFTFLTGLNWGLVSVIFLTSEEPIYSLYIICVYSGYLAITITSNALYFPSFLAFAVPSTVLFATMSFVQQQPTYTAIGITVIFYSCVIFFFARKARDLFKQSRELIFENQKLLRELTIQKEAAEKANIEKSLFMAATSHDLRQPIHAQGLLLEALKGNNSTDHTLVEKLTESNAALHGLFDSLLEISQLDSGTTKVNKSHQPIYAICQQVINEFEISASDKKLALTLTGKECTVFTDPILIGRILRNLVSNAIKYTNQGSVIINVSTHGQKVLLSVTDTGIGIAAEEHEIIFSEYTQLNNNARDRHKGVGLGLALVRRMCALLEYDVTVESAPGEGATFTLQLPFGDSSKVITTQEAPSPVAIQDLDIVLVDDELPILEAMQALLSQWKCRCHAFATIEEAEQSIATGDYNVDIIISDYRLSNDVTGIDCIKRLRQVIDSSSDKPTETPAVLISGDTDPQLLKQLQDGGFYMLHKPLKPAALRNVMAILLNA